MFEKLKKILVEEFGLEESEISLDSRLNEDLGLSSIELADLVMVCEDTFNFRVKSKDMDNFTTIGDVVNYLETH